MTDWMEQEFDLAPDVIYMNHAAVAPWPRRTAEAVRRFAAENAERGAQHYPRWLETEQRLREQAAELLNAPSADDIALLKNTSEALSVVAHGLPWKSGENVVISDQEFPSNRIVWESLNRYGVEVREASLDNGGSAEEALLARCDENTRLLSISSVQYGTGRRMDLARLGRHCRQEGILFCVDAIQSIGALATDVQAVDADFMMADGHKWMLGPEGIALFYCRASVRERLQLFQYGWHMTDHPSDFDRREWMPAPSARRFECGSPNMLGIHALSASLEVLLEAGVENVEARVLERSTRLINGFQANPDIRILTPTTDGAYGGIVTFTHRRIEPGDLHTRLTQAGVVCAQRAGGVRLSPHFHTRLEHVEQVVALVEAM